MANTRPFATGSSNSGTKQYGTTNVGTTLRDYTNYGGKTWVMGPDENRGWITSKVVSGRPYGIGFLGADGFSETNFIDTVNKGFGQSHVAGYAAYNSISASNYTNYTPIVSDGLVLDLDASNFYSYPGSGTTWTSTTGSISGTLINGPTFSTDGSGSIVFDGGDDAVQLAYNTTFNFQYTSSFTLECFAYVNQNGGTGFLLTNRASKDGNNISYAGWFLAQNGRQVDAGIGGYSSGFDWRRTTISTTDFTNYVYQKWAHIVWSYDGTLAGSKVYINGNNATSQSLDDNTPPYIINYNGTQKVTLGRSDADGPGHFLNGKIAVVRIYNKALTASEVLQNYTAQATRFGHTPLVTKGLITYYDIQNPASYPGSGTTIYDISGNSNNCTLVNGPTYSTDGSGSIDFDGVDDYGEITVPSYLKSNVSSTITISAWVKWKTITTGMMLGFQTYDVWLIDSRIGYNNGQSNQIGITSTEATNLGLIGNWKHYTFVMNSYNLLSNNEIYINGVKQSIAPVRGNDGYTQPFNNLRLASWLNGSYNGPVRYADFAMYDRALNEGEILQNYNSSKARFGL